MKHNYITNATTVHDITCRLSQKKTSSCMDHSIKYRHVWHRRN